MSITRRRAAKLSSMALSVTIELTQHSRKLEQSVATTWRGIACLIRAARMEFGSVNGLDGLAPLQRLNRAGWRDMVIPRARSHQYR